MIVSTATDPLCDNIGSIQVALHTQVVLKCVFEFVGKYWPSMAFYNDHNSRLMATLDETENRGVKLSTLRLEFTMSIIHHRQSFYFRMEFLEDLRPTPDINEALNAPRTPFTKTFAQISVAGRTSQLSIAYMFQLVCLLLLFVNREYWI